MQVMKGKLHFIGEILVYFKILSYHLLKEIKPWKL
jgi:hypothetical protein